MGRGIRGALVFVCGMVVDMTISGLDLEFLIPYLPFAWLGILAYLTWDFLHWKPIHNFAVSAFAKLGVRKPMISYLVVAVVGGALFSGYWWGVQKIFEGRGDAKKLELQAAEMQRREGVLRSLRQEYILGHDNLSPGMIAGTEPLPQDWLERRLKELGETWKPLAEQRKPETRPAKEPPSRE